MSESSNLAQREFAPLKEGALPLKGEALAKLGEELGGGWSVVEHHHLEKEYIFDDFRQALDFTNKVGELAESVGHHPDICLSWGKVKVIIWTHKIGGLNENDFIFAARTDALLEAG
jgi:4a-hydroxytetrahydrobiopterin dehydratase